jgi:CheY-like chemotaxis protein
LDLNSSNNNSNTREMKVLLVDDDHEDRQAFAEAIEKLNLPARVSYLQDCKDLFTHLENNPDINLVLMDINMPVKNGKVCLKELKMDDRYKHIPIVIYTVSLSETDIKESFESGAHYYVVKPYAHANFLQTMQAVFNIDWKEAQPVPARENFVINFAYTK